MTTPTDIAAPPTAPRRRFRWWHAVGIFIIVNAISVLPAGYNGDEAFYNNFQLPAIAPPDWLFAPMWLFLNITSLIALARVANAPKQTKTHVAFTCSRASVGYSSLYSTRSTSAWVALLSGLSTQVQVSS